MRLRVKGLLGVVGDTWVVDEVGDGEGALRLVDNVRLRSSYSAST